MRDVNTLASAKPYNVIIYRLGDESASIAPELVEMVPVCMNGKNFAFIIVIVPDGSAAGPMFCCKIIMKIPVEEKIIAC